MQLGSATSTRACQPRGLGSCCCTGPRTHIKHPGHCRQEEIVAQWSTGWKTSSVLSVRVKIERDIFVIKLYLSHNTAKKEKAVLWITIACHFHSQTPSTFQLSNLRHQLICTCIFISVVFGLTEISILQSSSLPSLQHALNSLIIH